jgi:hypothetical protein
MRWIFLVLTMLLAMQTFALTVTDPPLKDRIRAMLQAVDPAKPETSAQVEETVVALGKDALPDMQDVFTELCASRLAAEQDGRWDHARLWEARVTVLDRALVRLQTGLDWPRLIRMWVKQQYKPEQQGVADAMPEPVRVTDLQLERAFPGYLFYISHFSHYPVTRAPTPPLASNNLFAVKKDMGPVIAGQMPPPKQIALLTDADLLKAFFLAVPKPLLVPGVDIDMDKLEAGMKDLTYTWLRMSGELHSNLFIRFTIPAESLSFAVSAADAGGYMSLGRAEVVPSVGNSGFIEASLFFNNVALLIDVKEVVKLQPSPRQTH